MLEQGGEADVRCEEREMVMVISTKNSSYSPTGPGQAMPDISIEKEGLAEISGFEQSPPPVLSPDKPGTTYLPL